MTERVVQKIKTEIDKTTNLGYPSWGYFLAKIQNALRINIATDGRKGITQPEAIDLTEHLADKAEIIDINR